MVVEEVEAALTLAVEDGNLLDTAVANSSGAAYASKGLATIVQSGSFTWEIVAQVAVVNGQRVIKVFHMLPL